MGSILQTTAFSPNIKDRLDFSCAVFGPDGGLCAQAAHIPVHLGSMAYAMRNIVHSHDWHAGDTLILNDPFLGGTHLPDVTVISPVFSETKLIAFVANRAHYADIGAATPGSMPLATRLEDEGLIISPTMIQRDRQFNEILLQSILSRVSNPDHVKADLVAQINSNYAAEKHLQDVVAAVGRAQFLCSLDNVNDYAERLAKTGLSAIPDGCYEYEDYMDDDGHGSRNIKIKTTITIDKQHAHVDFTGTSPQVSGNINCPLSVAVAAVYYCFYALMPNNTPACLGSFRPFSITAKKGSLLNAQAPAAVAAGNVETSSRLVDVVLGALAQAIPKEIPAASQGTMNNVAMGSDDWDYYETLAGGTGAHSASAGLNAVQSHMTNTANTPVEILEMYYPLRINRYAIRQRSGGSGKFTGGHGLIREYSFLAPGSVSLLTERRTHKPWGLAGGRAGKPGQNVLNSQILPSKTNITMRTGDTLCIKTPGGGGWGV